MNKKYFFKYAKDKILNYIYRVTCKQPKVLNDLDTIDYILKNRCSITRFGDGELRLMRGIDLEFQDYNKELSKKLKSCKTNDKCLVCIPDIFNRASFNLDNIKPGPYEYWEQFKSNRGGLWNFYFGKQTILGDAFISRFYLRKKDPTKIPAYVEKLKQLWQDRNIIFVEGAQSRLGVGNDLFDNAKSIKRILCPPVNSYEKYNEIKHAILDNANKEDLVILALGPTATALAFEMSEYCQCLDLGHIDIEYEWFRMGATKKVPIPSKYVNEADGGRNPEDSTDEKYKSEIIKTIN